MVRGAKADRSASGRLALTALSTPLGWLVIFCDGEAIVQIGFCKKQPQLSQAGVFAASLLNEAKRQLTEYFAQKRRQFELPLCPEGTAFQKEVWQELLTIPYGETISYSALASRLGKPLAARAIGQACHDNPISIVIPCHRVVGKNGSLTGYAGGLKYKRFLLQLEAAIVRSSPGQD
ncbi:MAG: methylated-DNA--[protein]-cysteine S-methyltransferase [Turneriella sp.]|nr:methylated-DNA--[protein]-cysteine S-methyltransferase [Turneriella sp.]